MKIKNIPFRIFLLLILIALPTSGVHAQGPGGDVVLFGDNYTLAKGETLSGSVLVIGGNITIEEEATVNGDVILIGGNLQADGSVGRDVVLVGGNMIISDQVDGDIVIIGGQIELTATAVVDGSVTTIGGQMKRDPEAQISGDIVNNAPPIDIPDVPDMPDLPVPPEVPSPPDITYNVNPLWTGMNVLFRALAVTAIGMLLTLFFQPQFERVGDAIVRQPFLAGSFGLLTMVVAPLVILIMLVTVILIPVAAIVALFIPLGWLFGMIAIGQEVGDRFTKAINQTWAPVLSAGFGTFLLMILGGFIGLIPCVGWLIPFVIGLGAVGGVMMTWFGTRGAPGGTPALVEVPPTS